jgi:hypothetical protein
MFTNTVKQLIAEATEVNKLWKIIIFLNN